VPDDDHNFHGGYYPYYPGYIYDPYYSFYYDPFYSTREGGLGLGLSLSESLASEMGGALAADPSVARGARFVLSLPLLAQTPA